MTRPSRARLIRTQRALGGQRNAVRAEQLRACGRSDRAIARELGVSTEAIARWFDLQDELVLTAESA